VIALLDTSEDIRIAQNELGCPVEQLLTPLTRFQRQDRSKHFAIDNGSFTRFDETSFRSLLERESVDYELCRFVTVPDIVGSARRTLEVFSYWCHRLPNWSLALVAQDGQEDLEIPWSQIRTIFIGGTTKFKLSTAAADIVKTAKAIGKWVHAGRVNTPGRFEYFEDLGADSIDGTGLARFSWMREQIYKRDINPRLYA
jgi:hypothetical protein